MNGYDLSRMWFDFCFENPDIVKPTHTALYFFAIEHCNRLGWKEKFSFPTEMAKEAIGVKSYNTYINTINDLVDWGFIKMIQKSTNQYSANIIALSKNNKAHNKALDKAMIKHVTKQGESTGQSTSESIDSIDKHKTINNEPLTNNPNGLSDSGESGEKSGYNSIPKTKDAIYNFLKTKPTEIQAYVDYWNIFASETGKGKVKALSEKRKLKLRVRIREDTFNLNEILRKAKDSEMLRTSKWFALDWIIANDTNYLKVLEGNYDNGARPSDKNETHETKSGTDRRILEKIGKQQ